MKKMYNCTPLFLFYYFIVSGQKKLVYVLNKNQECFLICCFFHQNGKKRQFGKCKSVRVICSSSGAARSTNHFDWLQLHLMDMIVQKCNFFTTKTIVFKGKNISWLYCIHSRWWFSFHLTMESCQQSLLCNLYVSESSNWTEHSGMSKALSPFKKTFSECKTILISMFGLMSWTR